MCILYYCYKNTWKTTDFHCEHGYFCVVCIMINGICMCTVTFCIFFDIIALNILWHIFMWHHIRHWYFYFTYTSLPFFSPTLPSTTSDHKHWETIKENDERSETVLCFGMCFWCYTHALQADSILCWCIETLSCDKRHEARQCRSQHHQVHWWCPTCWF